MAARARRILAEVDATVADAVAARSEVAGHGRDRGDRHHGALARRPSCWTPCARATRGSRCASSRARRPPSSRSSRPGSSTSRVVTLPLHADGLVDDAALRRGPRPGRADGPPAHPGRRPDRLRGPGELELLLPLSGPHFARSSTRPPRRAGVSCTPPSSWTGSARWRPSSSTATARRSCRRPRSPATCGTASPSSTVAGPRASPRRASRCAATGSPRRRHARSAPCSRSSSRRARCRAGCTAACTGPRRDQPQPSSVRVPGGRRRSGTRRAQRPPPARGARRERPEPRVEVRRRPRCRPRRSGARRRASQRHAVARRAVAEARA